jgi:hypothetical protein
MSGSEGGEIVNIEKTRAQEIVRPWIRQRRR